MKERMQNLLIGLGLVAVGAVCFVISKDYTMSIGSFTLDYRIAAVFFAAVGLVFLLLALLKKSAPQAAPVPAQATAEAEEDPRELLRQLEQAMDLEPDNAALAQEFLRCSDALLHGRGDKSFYDYQQRFFTARRAVYIEEKHGLAPANRRFRAVHSAVHGGITAATARQPEQLEDALDMLTAAAQLRCEGTLAPALEQRYSDTAVSAVTCWVCYWLSRSYLGETPDFRRSAELLKQAITLCPPEGIRACDLNPRMTENTKVMLTPAHLQQLKRLLLSKVKGQ